VVEVGDLESRFGWDCTLGARHSGYQSVDSGCIRRAVLRVGVACEKDVVVRVAGEKSLGRLWTGCRMFCFRG
jgi:hypothetical protein